MSVTVIATGFATHDSYLPEPEILKNAAPAPSQPQGQNLRRPQEQPAQGPPCLKRLRLERIRMTTTPFMTLCLFLTVNEEKNLKARQTLCLAFFIWCVIINWVSQRR